MGTAVKHPVPDQVKLKFLTSGHSDAQRLKTQQTAMTCTLSRVWK